MREWKPGDVAMVQVGNAELFCTFYDTGRERGWFHGLGLTTLHYVAQEREAIARPLVVIDPEDREQTAALTKVMVAARLHEVIDLHGAVKRALREFANPTPPKPDEPTGLGAVVECEHGVTCVRTSNPEFPWINAAQPGANSYHWTEYGGLPELPVRVLSEGVTP